MVHRRIMLMLFSGGFLLSLGLVTYAVCLRVFASEIISSANEIRSVADAWRQLAAWRRRLFAEVIEEPIATGGDRSYDVQLTNTLLSKLRIAQPTMVQMTVTMRGGELRSVTLVMETGREPRTGSGVISMEWFIHGLHGGIHLHGHRPRTAVVEFLSETPEAQRRKAFALNPDCVVKPTGCKSAEDILPGVWQLAH